MATRTKLGAAMDFGIATGLRSMTPAALLSQHLGERPMWQLDSRAERSVASRPAQVLLGLAAFGELLVDKLPTTPSRMEPHSLLFRAGCAAVGGGMLMHRARQPALLGAMVGALGAVSGASAGYHARRALTERGVPDAAVAVVEDVLTIAIARRAIQG